VQRSSVHLALALALLITAIPAQPAPEWTRRFGALAPLPARQAPPETLERFPGACGGAVASDAETIYLPLVGGGAPRSARGSRAVPALPALAARNLEAAKAVLLQQGALSARPSLLRQSALAPERAAIVRGRVIDRDGAPLADVGISVLGHPEYDSVRSAADGSFDLAVNGGVTLTFCYEREGYLPAQRQLTPPWLGYAWLDDVALVQPDSTVTRIDLSADLPIQALRASPVADADGARRATLFFLQGTRAEMIMPDGSAAPLDTLSVRMTEFTLGERGPEAMVATLPPASKYTYAAEFSVDEALAAGAVNVRFSRPVFFYLENFIGFPVGMPMPTGYYDRLQGAWVPEDDGRVLGVLAVANGLAQLDLDGSGRAASPEALAALGIGEAELAQIAVLYQPGQSLWRVPISHFTPFDCNSPATVPDDAVPPPKLDPIPTDDDPCEERGSIIECENQILGERVSVVGTPFSLNYRSNRTPGYRVGNRVELPLGDQLPASLRRIDVDVQIAGQRLSRSFTDRSAAFAIVDWDGRDAYGRVLKGSQRAQVRVGYVYGIVYQQPGALGRTFARFSAQGVKLTGNREQATLALERTFEIQLEGRDDRSFGLGGWTLDVQHSFDPLRGQLLLGSGQRQAANAVNGVGIVAGSGTIDEGAENEDKQAVDVALVGARDMDLAADGGLLVASGRCTVWRISPNGRLHRVAGTGNCERSLVERGDARSIGLLGLLGIDQGPDGSLYLVERASDLGVLGPGRVWRVGADGQMAVVAGNPRRNPQRDGIGDGGPATQAYLDGADDVAVAPDGTLYISEAQGRRLRQVTPDGVVETIAGGLTRGDGSVGDGGPARQAELGRVTAVAVGPDGSIYLAHEATSGRENNGARIRRIGPDGTISTVAGPGRPNLLPNEPEGESALGARVEGIQDLEVAADGSIYYSSSYGAVYKIDEYGVLTRLAGQRYRDWLSGNCRSGIATPNGTLPLQAQFCNLGGLALAPDGTYYFSDQTFHRVRKVGAGGLPIENRVEDGLTLVASADGGEVYTFDADGRHLRTQDALTAATRYSFGYDSAARLTSISDGDGNVTTIERDAQGNPTAIVGPYGARTSLGLDENGYLSSITNPAGEAYAASYHAGGLLASFRDPRGGESRFGYDSLGRLVEDDGPGPGVVRFTRVNGPEGSSVTLLRPGGQARTYTASTANGTTRRVIARPDGVQLVSAQLPSGGRQTIYPDGGAHTSLPAPNPQFGASAPIAAATVLTTPAGLRYERLVERDLRLSQPFDPLSLVGLTETVRINGRSATSRYDAASRTLTLASPAGRRSVQVFDPQGRLLRSQLPGLAPEQRVYDERGRLLSITQGEGSLARSTRYSYNEAGQLASVLDPLGRIWSMRYDLAGRLVAVTRPDGQATTYSYDPAANLTAITPPDRAALRFAYAPDNRLERISPPDLGAGEGATSYSYDADRRLATIALADGTTVSYGRDASGRLETISAPQLSYRYRYLGDRLARAEASESSVEYRYDGRLLRAISWSGAISGGVQFGYGASMRLNELRVNNANPISLSYDDDDLLVRVGGMTLARDQASGFIRSTALGQLNTSSSYDLFGGLASYEARSAQAQLYQANYARDPGGRLVALTETIGLETSVYAYSYDLVGRLSEVRRDGALQASYRYDSHGNRLSISWPDGTRSASYDLQDRLLDDGTSTYSYSASGDLRARTTGGQTTSYIYDALGNLRGVGLSDGRQIGYLVDAENRRIGKLVNGTRQRAWLYEDDLRPIAELDANNALVSRFVYGADTRTPSYMVRDGISYRIVSDHLGSPRLVIDAATGLIAQRIDYDAFGRVLRDTNPGFQPFGFAGGLYDPDTGLVRFGARDYDPNVGRWTQREPAPLAGGDSNPYVYVGNDPVNYADPSGEVVPLVVAALLALEVGLSVSDLIDLVEGLESGCMSDAEIAAAAALLLLGLIGPGGGYNKLKNWLSRFGDLFQTGKKAGGAAKPMSKLDQALRQAIGDVGGDPNKAPRAARLPGQGSTRPSPRNNVGSYWDR
jgi:RHS repeat-associated protein